MRTHASPYEITFNVAVSFVNRSIFGAVCILVFCFFCIQSVSAQSKPAAAQPPSCEVTKQETQKKAKPNTKPAAAKPASLKSLSTQSAKSLITPAANSTQNAAKPSGLTVTRGTTKPQPTSMVSTRTKAKAEVITSELATDLPSNIEQGISKFFGLKYRFGGEGQNGIDCSALVKQVYSDVFGINLPRTSTEQSRLGGLEYVPQGDLKTGDLVFFGSNRKTVNHVGMYLSGGHFLNATRSEGVTISRLDDSYWKSRFMFSKRMHGIDAGEDDTDDVEDAMDFRRDFLRDSYQLIKDREHESEVSFLDFGAKLNNSLELLLSGFLVNSLADHDPTGDITPQPSPMSGSESTRDTGGGFRMSAVLSPLEWITLIPSVTHLDVQDDRGSDYQRFGLETWMILPSTRVAVFMAAYAKNQEDLFDRPFHFSPEWQTMDVSLGLHYKLSDSLRFSLWGTHGYTPDARTKEDTGAGRRPPIDDVSFELNVQF